MQGRTSPAERFRNRKEAERVLADILNSGGVAGHYRIDEEPDGRCVIVIFENDGQRVAGVLGA